MSVAALAAAARVSEADVRAAEEGELLPAMEASGLCVALDLPLADHVAGFGTGLPRPVDEAHRRRLDGVRRAVDDHEGLLVCPDLVARADAEPTPHRSARRRAWDRIRGWRDADVIATTKVGVAVTLASVLLVPGVARATGLAAPVANVLEAAMTAMGLAVMALPTVTCVVLDLVSRRLAVRADVGDASHDGYVLTPRGLVGLRFGADRRILRETLVRSVEAVDHVPHGDAHVTLRVRGDCVTVELPWIRRSRDLSDAVAAWGAPTG